MKPDVIVTWPIGYDYVLWRYQWEQVRRRFGKLHVVFNDMGIFDLFPFITGAVRQARFDSIGLCLKEWRHDSINKALRQSRSEWVLFTEQDFFIKDSTFLDRVFAAAKEGDGVVWPSPERYHPAFALLRRSVIDQTNCFFDPAYFDDYSHLINGQPSFGALLDHFVVFTWELKKFAKVATFDELGIVEGKDFYHLEDITQNYKRVMNDDFGSITSPSNFFAYNNFTQFLPVVHSKIWGGVVEYADSYSSGFSKFLHV